MVYLSVAIRAALSIAMFPYPGMGSPTYDEEYRGCYKPKSIDTGYGLQIVAPDTPYVAAAGRNMLYFIDTRFDIETARHIKDQIERATVTRMDEYISIDEILATAKVVTAKTGMTTFVFDPPYARVLFARGINRQNPELKLPEHEIAGPWLISYDLGVMSTQAQQCYNSSNDEGLRSCCSRAVDTPREDGETDADYYQRMDKLHWQTTVVPAESDIIN